MAIEKMNLSYLDFTPIYTYRNLPIQELIDRSIEAGYGQLNDTGALMVDTGEFTGRSPKDRFIVLDDCTQSTVDWNSINQPFSSADFDVLFDQMRSYINTQQPELYVRDVYACADADYRLNVRVINELPWQNIFAHNMFIEPSLDGLNRFEPDWHVIAVPSFKADPDEVGTRQENFSIINFSKKIILIGGSAYTGEIKKGIFSVLNFVLPKKECVLSMHCSANKGEEDDVAIFFGLSGTGKTTLSADASRQLIGDDEHGWGYEGVFNFEGGCYAKVIDLSPEKEPEIFGAIKHGALLENVRCFPDTNKVDFSNTEVTQNTRVSYPIDHISNSALPSKGGHPKNIFMLTYDAFGVLPPISKLSEGQAMYQFISGFTSKVAGTEAGVNEPQSTFSACYGAPFMPLHPMEYASMLGDKMREHNTNVWLVNTGLTGGAYGTGQRMKLSHTRALIKAALSGELDQASFVSMPVFGFAIPQSCPGVPAEVLNPRSTWADKTAYDAMLFKLAQAFTKNFKQYAPKASTEVLLAAPILPELVVTE
ncbi:MAG: phosphoenolpyruvate carboxykinase (ATP) [Saprospiraceae bacterium]|nr:phosphoenolpyruvate carboxykinase (ATP) [Saprospiraceae bacterium]